jgi:MFS family permease
LQAFVTGYLIKQMQLQNTFYFFPIAAVTGAFAMILLPGTGIAIAAMALVKLVRDTIHDSGRASLVGLVPEERRGRVSTLMETYFPSIGTMVGCLLAGFVVFAGISFMVELSVIYVSIAVIAAVIAVYAIYMMTKNYDKSLLNWRLKRRQRRTDTSLLNKIID